MNHGPEISAEAVQDLIDAGVVIGPHGRLMIQWEADDVLSEASK